MELTGSLEYRTPESVTRWGATISRPRGLEWEVRGNFMQKILGLAAMLTGACVGQQTGAGFAVVGVAAGQTARINVVNEAPAKGPESMALPCRVTLQFFGAEGELLKERSIDDFSAGKIAFLDLGPGDRPEKETRTPVRAVVRWGYAGGANPPAGTAEACQVVPNMEVYETETGKTQLLLTETRPLSNKGGLAVP